MALFRTYVYVVKRKSAYDREEMRERTLENNGSPSVD